MTNRMTPEAWQMSQPYGIETNLAANFDNPRNPSAAALLAAYRLDRNTGEKQYQTNLQAMHAMQNQQFQATNSLDMAKASASMLSNIGIPGYGPAAAGSPAAMLVGNNYGIGEEAAQRKSMADAYQSMGAGASNFAQGNFTGPGVTNLPSMILGNVAQGATAEQGRNTRGAAERKEKPPQAEYDPTLRQWKTSGGIGTPESAARLLALNEQFNPPRPRASGKPGTTPTNNPSASTSSANVSPAKQTESTISAAQINVARNNLQRTNPGAAADIAATHAINGGSWIGIIVSTPNGGIAFKGQRGTYPVSAN